MLHEFSISSSYSIFDDCPESSCVWLRYSNLRETLITQDMCYDCINALRFVSVVNDQVSGAPGLIRSDLMRPYKYFIQIQELKSTRWCYKCLIVLHGMARVPRLAGPDFLTPRCHSLLSRIGAQFIVVPPGCILALATWLGRGWPRTVGGSSDPWGVGTWTGGNSASFCNPPDDR